MVSENESNYCHGKWFSHRKEPKSLNMVNKCLAHGCKTGYASEGKEEDIAVFKFPNKEKYPELRAKWVRWVNRQDFTVHRRHQPS